MSQPPIPPTATAAASSSAPASGPDSLITQVQPPSAAAGGGGGGPESLITQVKPPGDDDSSYPAGIIASVPMPGQQQSPAPAAKALTALQPAPTQSMTTQQPPRQQSQQQPPPPPLRTNSGGWSLFCCCMRRNVQTSESGHELSPTKGGGSNLEKSTAASGPPKPAVMKSAAASPTSPKRPADKKWLLKPLASEDVGKKCLVLDLDETLVHSSFKPVAAADFVIPVEIDNQIHNVYVLKRPGVDIFLQRLGRQFEVVVFTASLAKYADPVLDMLDKHRVVKHRLFREACLHHKGNYVKDLGQLGRDLKDIIILDNSPASYIFHPTNAIPISSWFNDPNDTELLDLIPFLEDLKLVENVMTVLANDTTD